MKFDDAFIDQVRNSVSIVDLVSGYVHLKKKGKDYAALCPIHHEKTPSFLVSETKRIFKCFGCGVGGDVFEFIMLMENLTFPESVRHLAERYGIPIPSTAGRNHGRSEERQRLLTILEIATQFFCQCLNRKEDALAYLRNRQISAETLKQFSIGYAPSGQQLLNELRRQSFTIEEALACGLVREGNSGQYYEKFRNRIMFPIGDLSGRTIAFGGRIFGEGLPKYLNSPETILYSKGNHLFPLDITRDEIRRRDFAILVEGYFDCIVPFQFGVRNVAASLGTSLTENQVKVLGRYTRNVVINFDPDSAGTTAALRSIDLFLQQGFRVNVLQLPRGEDPDTFVQNEGADAYWERVKTSQPYLDFALAQFIDAQRDPFNPKGKQEIVSQILPYVAKIPNKIERAEYVTRIASRLRLDENLLMFEMARVSQRKTASEVTPPSLVDQITPAERTLLVALLDEDWTTIASERVEPELFEDLRTEQIFQKVFQLKQENKDMSVTRLRHLLTEDTDRDLIEGLALRCSEWPLSEEIIRSSVQALRRKQYERLSHQIQEEIKREEKEQAKSDRIDELLIEKEKVRRKIRESELGPVSVLFSPEGSRK